MELHIRLVLSTVSTVFTVLSTTAVTRLRAVICQLTFRECVNRSPFRFWLSIVFQKNLSSQKHNWICLPDVFTVFRLVITHFDWQVALSQLHHCLLDIIKLTVYSIYCAIEFAHTQIFNVWCLPCTVTCFCLMRVCKVYTAIDSTG